MSYQGPLDLKKMTKQAKKAYEIWSQQKSRNTRNYSSRDFVGWWLSNLKTKNWKDPTCGRIDHSKGYSFDNIEMQERVDNIKERNKRLGNPGCKHKKVVAKEEGYKIKFFESKVTAARFYKVSEKTVYNHCQKRTKQFGKYGPITNARNAVFSWA